MKKSLLFIPFLLFADVDPFKAGDLNSPNPYGLTPTEKAILKNKEAIQENKKIILSLKKELKDVEDNLNSKIVMYDGIINDLKDKTSSISTIISEMDSFNNEIINLKKRVNNLKKNLSDIESNLSQLKSTYNNKFKQLQDSLNEIIKLQNENFKYLTDAIQDLVTQIKNQNISPKEAFEKAKKLYVSGKIDKAKNLFAYALSHNYLPATSSFYLGEIAFKKGNYKDALAFYKKSITLYPKKIYYTPILLYHSGIAFEKLGMKEEAKLTFKKLINDFKDSKYAQLAKKELEKLK